MSTWDGQLAALDPAASVVVEACAGSGKTWLLVARIVRLLLAGVAPGEILAITYTRKAAREIESRLREALREMALQPEEGLRQFLQQIGAASAAADCARARKLFEQVGGAQPPITLSTFHGWFAGLLKAAPLNTGLAGFELAQSETRLRDEVWQLFARDCGAQPQQPLTQSLLWLMQELGLDALRRLLFGFIVRRAEWHAFRDDGAAGFEAALERLRRDLGVAREPVAVADFWAQPGLGDELADCAALLEQDGTQTHRELAACLHSVLALEPDGEARFERLGRVFVKADGEPREIRGGQAMAKRLGTAAAARLVELHRRLGERFLQARRTRQEEAVFRFHYHALRVADAFLGSFERFKAERRVLDFADLEWHADRLLRDADTAGFLLARLDARYRHVLVDEFQDTNPLQWRILQAWLGAYDRPDEVPRLFLVGDPKQSIYRFRRAEPRLFETARGMLERQHGARLLANDLTRRNSPVVIEVVNRVFADQPSFAGFRAHTAFEQGLAGRVEVLPLCAPDAVERALADDAAAPLRNPLRAAAQESEDRRRRCEAQQLVARLRQVVGHWPVREGASERPARFSDVMILTRRRSVLPEFERALRAAGMPYLSVGRGGLLATLEAADLVALLRFLCVPAADLALAHALRSPLFALSDGDLMRIAAAAGDNWWSRLQRLAGLGQAGAAAARAARLLDAWLASAARLPVHDLLDRIYAEGELVARYRAAVAPAMWPGVEANLEAFIDLALAIDGGRYPSLPRFIDELDRLGQAADEDAPDEGVVRPAEDGAGHLRILTIHAAKGLEAPIVWLIDAHNTHRVPDIWRVLLDWPPGAQAPVHFSLTTSRERRGNARDALFQAEEQAQEREELNLLYVALTRARQYFFASGIEPLRRGRPNSAWERLVAAIGGAAEGGAWGAPPVEMTSAPPPPMAVPVPDSAAPPAPVGVRRAAPAPAAEAALAFGVALHRALELMAAPGCKVPPPPAAMAPGQWESVLASARAILAAPHLRLFFDPACFRRALNEVEFALPDGTLGRIDRLVDTGAEIWVLDYKSGAAVRSEDYRQQLEGYRAAMLPIAQGRPVRCALIFGDAALVEMC